MIAKASVVVCVCVCVCVLCHHDVFTFRLQIDEFHQATRDKKAISWGLLWRMEIGLGEIQENCQ